MRTDDDWLSAANHNPAWTDSEAWTNGFNKDGTSRTDADWRHARDSSMLGRVWLMFGPMNCINIIFAQRAASLATVMEDDEDEDASSTGKERYASYLVPIHGSTHVWSAAGGPGRY